ncbi:MAG: DUF5719 family protein [Actinomycetota bacterium]
MTDAGRAKEKRARGQGFFALVALGGIIVAAVALGRLGTAPTSAAEGGAARSGSWYCPHGGGEGWEVRLQVANPGEEPVRVRVASFGEEGPAGEPAEFEIGARSVRSINVPADALGAGAMVEYFDGFAAAGWVTESADEKDVPGGVAAEPCTRDVGTRFLLPDGTAARGEDAYAVILNPFAQPAVFTVRLYTPGERPVETPEQVLRPHHASAIHLNEFGVLGQPTVAAEVKVSVGRVSAATLGQTKGGGLRASVGVVSGSPQGRVLPGGLDTGTADLAVMNTTTERIELEAHSFTGSGDRTTAGAQGQPVSPESAATFRPLTTDPTTLYVAAANAAIVTGRRTSGTDGDRASTVGVPYGTTGPWVVLPAVGGRRPFDTRLYISNQSPDVAAEVTVTLLGAEGVSLGRDQQRLSLKPRVTAYVELPHEAPHAAVLVESTGAEVVPAFTSYSNDRTGYAVSVGVPSPG